MSDSFVVSARKYRPSNFDSMLGQEHITVTLKKAIANNHLAQAYLFTGPRGVGKTTCARILAKAVNCENLSADGEPCNQCKSCTTFNEQRSMNIFELDAASNNSVEDIRLLNDQVRFPPQAGKFKTYIIDEVHMLSTAAFNAFLKTLEEPPSYTIFILATTEKHKIIPTILSRCQINDFKRLEIKDIVKQLQLIAEKENISAEETALHIIATKADGAMRDALTVFDKLVSVAQDKITYEFVISNLNIIDYEYFFKITNAICSADIQQSILILDELVKAGFDEQNFLNGLSEHLRTLILSKMEKTAVILDIPDTLRSRYHQQANSIDKNYLINALNIIHQFSLSFKESKNPRLHTEIALMKLSYLTDAISLATQLQEQKKNSDN